MSLIPKHNPIIDKYYEVLELLEYDLNKAAFTVLHYYGEDEENGISKKKILKDLENRDVNEYAAVFDEILENKEAAIHISLHSMFKSNEEYIDYLRELLTLHDVDFVEWVKPREVRVDRLTGSLFE